MAHTAIKTGFSDAPQAPVAASRRGVTVSSLIDGLFFGLNAYHEYQIAIRQGLAPGVAARRALDLD